jgi:iron complex outermembrane receptor protein
MSRIYAYNKTIHDYLIYTPPSRFQNSIGFHFGNLSGLKRIFFSVEDVYVSKQSRVPVGQDYVLPPAGYNLINLQLSFRLNYLHNYADISFAVNNLTNTAYRDYLDRFRYFTDEPGRNFIVRLKVPFKISKTTHTNR